MKHPIHEMKVLVAPDKETDRFLPEGPRDITIDGREALIWVNIQTAAEAKTGSIRARFWDTGELRDFPQPARPGFVLPTTREGQVVVGREKEVGLLDLKSAAWTSWATIADADPRTIINDGEITPGGRAIVFGTKDTRFAEPIAHLYLYMLGDKQVTPLADSQVCSNGKFFTAMDNDVLIYDIDTPKRNVVRYRLDLVNRRFEESEIVLDLQGIEGFPDGMVDAGDRSAIIAFYNPARVAEGRAFRFRFSTGEILEEWIVPGSPRVTCPFLTLRDGRVQLVLTTAVEGMPDELRLAAPNAGNVFIGETALTVLPPAETIRL